METQYQARKFAKRTLHDMIDRYGWDSEHTQYWSGYFDGLLHGSRKITTLFEYSYKAGYEDGRGDFTFLVED